MLHPVMTGLLALTMRAPPPRMSSNWWFDPIARFGPIDDAPTSDSPRPLLLVLPGLDGSGITAWTQFPELSLDYDIKCLGIPADDRSTYNELVQTVTAEVQRADADGREVLLLGESMGSGIALDVARAVEPSQLSALVLVSPATAWDQTWLGKLRGWLVTLPEPLLALIIALTTYQLFDLDLMLTTARRIATGEKAPILDTPARIDYAWRVVGAMPTALASPPGTVKHRIAAWAEPSIAAARELSDLRTPMLLVAGTADLRVPAEAEAQRIAAEAPSACRCAVHLVEGAGHAGATDERLDLRVVLRRWRHADAESVTPAGSGSRI